MFKKIVCLVFLTLLANATFAGNLVQCPEGKDWVSSAPYYDNTSQEVVRNWTLSEAKQAEGWYGSRALPLFITSLSNTFTIVYLSEMDVSGKFPKCNLAYLDDIDATLVSAYNKKLVNSATLHNFTNFGQGYYVCRGNNCTWEWAELAACPEAKDFKIGSHSYTSVGLTLKVNYLKLQKEKEAEGWELETDQLISDKTTSITAEKNTVDMQSDGIPHCKITLTDGVVIKTQNIKYPVNFYTLNWNYFTNSNGYYHCENQTAKGEANYCQWVWNYAAAPKK